VPTPESDGFEAEPEMSGYGYGWAKRLAEIQARCYQLERKRYWVTLPALALVKGLQEAIVCHQSSAAFLVHQQSAWLAGPDPAEFAQGMIRLLNNGALAMHIGTNARRLAETTFSWSEIAQEVETVYRGVLSRRRGSGQEAAAPLSSSADRHATNKGLS